MNHGIGHLYQRQQRRTDQQRRDPDGENGQALSVREAPRGIRDTIPGPTSPFRPEKHKKESSVVRMIGSCQAVSYGSALVGAAHRRKGTHDVACKSLHSLAESYASPPEERSLEDLALSYPRRRSVAHRAAQVPAVIFPFLDKRVSREGPVGAQIIDIV